jgi:hypothetical protein
MLRIAVSRNGEPVKFEPEATIHPIEKRPVAAHEMRIGGRGRAQGHRQEKVNGASLDIAPYHERRVVVLNPKFGPPRST